MIRKSASVPLRLLSALAGFAKERSESPIRRHCVDHEDQIVPEICCENSAIGATYRWLYGGTTKGRIGDRVEGGSREPILDGPGFGVRHGGHS
jgi:hypothetical protein